MDSEELFDHSTTQGKIRCLLRRLLYWKRYILAFSILILLFLIYVGFFNTQLEAGSSPLKLGLEISTSPDKLQKCLLHKGLNASSITFRDQNSTSAQYNVLNYQWNKYNGEIRPFAYVLPRTVQEVQATIECTRDLEIRVVARSGGHSTEKYCFGNSSSVIIDFQKQDAVSMDMINKTVEVQSGVRTGSELIWSSSTNYFLPHGVCKTVGISYSLGGGYNNFIRLYGYLLDLLLELDMVDYKGALITANKDSNSDLFWALRGGGAGGSFGFVTRFKFELRPIPNKIFYGLRTYPLPMFPEVFAAFQKIVSTNFDRTLYLEMRITNSEITVELDQAIVSDINPTPVTVHQLFQNFFPDINTTQISSLSYEEYFNTGSGDTKSESGDAEINTDNIPVYLEQKSFFVRNVVGQADIRKISEFIQNITEYISVMWHIHGGAVNDVGPQETAFAHRDGVLYVVLLIYNAPVNRTQSDEDKSLQWLHDFYEATKNILGHNSSYQNIQDNEMKDFLQRYYGANLKRLQKVKKKYDPENYFQYQQSIPPI